MEREIEKIYILINSNDIIEGILVEYIEQKFGKKEKKYYSEHIIKCYSKREKRDFSLLVAKILLSSINDEKIEYIHQKNEYSYSNLRDKILWNHYYTPLEPIYGIISTSCTALGCIGSVLPVQILGALASKSGLNHINDSISTLGKNARKKVLKRFYAMLLGINLLSIAIPSYQELTKSQLERDIDNFIDHKGKAFIFKKNPFDFDIEYTNDEKIELLMNAIEENPYLEKKDKDILYQFKSLLQDNPYIDYQNVYEKFMRLGIIYTEEKYIEEEKISMQDPPEVLYDKELNYIIVYHTVNEGNDHQKEISNLLMNIIGEFEGYSCLNRGMQKLLTDLYITKDNSNTSYDKLVARLMLLTVGKEKLFEAYSTKNFEIIEQCLKEINDSEENYEQLLTILRNDDSEEYKSKKDTINVYETFVNYIDSKNRELTRSQEKTYLKK